MVFGSSSQEHDLKNACPTIEICEADRIQYITPLDNNEGFFVPEVAKEREAKKEH